jgi:hypothetical protein
VRIGGDAKHVNEHTAGHLMQLPGCLLIARSPPLILAM